MTTIKKAAVKPATVGLVAPANWLDDVLLAAGVAELQAAGLTVKQAPNLGKQVLDMAGKPGERAAGVMTLATDPAVDVLLAVGAGYGCIQMVDYLDWTALRAAGKPLVGYHDITYLLNAWRQQEVALTWHGPLLSDVARYPERADVKVLLDILRHPTKAVAPAKAFSNARVITAGRATGAVWGGNLAVLNSTVGSVFAPPERPNLLFIEEIGERIHKIDRWLHQLRHAGWLEHVAGVLVGRMSKIDDYAAKPFGLSVEEVMTAHFGGKNIPMVTGLDCGHGGLNYPLPLGMPMRLEAGSSGVTLQQV